MIDISLIRTAPDILDSTLKKRGKAARSAQILTIDEKYRHSLSELQKLQNQRNELSKQVGIIKSQKKSESEVEQILTSLEKLKINIHELEHSSRELKTEIDQMLLSLPNILDESVPVGNDANANTFYRKHGTPPKIEAPLTHCEIGKMMRLMDFESAAKVTGSRFVFLYKDLAKMELALASFMLDIHTKEYDYEHVSPPLLVNEQSLIGTGQLPSFEGNNLYQTNDGKYLIPTSEVSVTNIIRDEILSMSDLPLRFVAYTPCFRLEAGAAGIDTKGMIRQHQFYKVELVSVVHSDNSWDELERKLKAAEQVLKRLELPFRTMVLCSADTGNSSSKTYDIEVWLPSQNCYREISSCSNFLDFHTRRMRTRFYEDKQHKHTLYPHTLNGSGVAVGRALIAIIENYQEKTKNGMVIHIPTGLQPYMDGQKIIESRKK